MAANKNTSHRQKNDKKQQLNRFLKFCFRPFINETSELTSPLNKDDLRDKIEEALKVDGGLNISGKFTRPYAFTTSPKIEFAQIRTIGTLESSTYLDGIIEDSESGCRVKLSLNINPVFLIILLMLFAFIPLGLLSGKLFTAVLFIGVAVVTFVSLRYYLITVRKELLDSFKRILLFSLNN